MSGESDSIAPGKAITQQMIEAVVHRHGKEFMDLIANFQKFIMGLVTIVHKDDAQAHGGYSLIPERCYELNLQQRVSFLKYLANEIVLRAYTLATTPEKYPAPEDFEKSKA